MTRISVDLPQQRGPKQTVLKLALGDVQPRLHFRTGFVPTALAMRSTGLTLIPY